MGFRAHRSQEWVGLTGSGWGQHGDGVGGAHRESEGGWVSAMGFRALEWVGPTGKEWVWLTRSREWVGFRGLEVSGANRRMECGGGFGGSLGFEHKHDFGGPVAMEGQDDGAQIPQGIRDVVVDRPNTQTSFGFVLQSNTLRAGCMICESVAPGYQTGGMCG